MPAGKSVSVKGVRPSPAGAEASVRGSRPQAPAPQAAVPGPVSRRRLRLLLWNWEGMVAFEGSC